MAEYKEFTKKMTSSKQRIVRKERERLKRVALQTLKNQPVAAEITNSEQEEIDDAEAYFRSGESNFLSNHVAASLGDNREDYLSARKHAVGATTSHHAPIDQVGPNEDDQPAEDEEDNADALLLPGRAQVTLEAALEAAGEDPVVEIPMVVDDHTTPREWPQVSADDLRTQLLQILTAQDSVSRILFSARVSAAD